MINHSIINKKKFVKVAEAISLKLTNLIVLNIKFSLSNSTEILLFN